MNNRISYDVLTLNYCEITYEDTRLTFQEEVYRNYIPACTPSYTTKEIAAPI